MTEGGIRSADLQWDRFTELNGLAYQYQVRLQLTECLGDWMATHSVAGRPWTL